MKSADVIVIGGGLTGASTALGLVRGGAKVLMFDEQLSTQRLSRANFGLTWFMCKGTNNVKYAQWCRMACQMWPDYAAQLKEETGISPELEWVGGALHAFGDEQWQGYADAVSKLKDVCATADMDYPVRMLDRQEFQELVPKMQLGEMVTGAMYTSEQGHANPLTLLAAMRKAFQMHGGEFLPRLSITSITPKSSESIVLKTNQGEFSCAKLVVAAGHGCNRLLAPLGGQLKVYPQRGQLMVTERCERKLDFPMLAVRQTQEGTFMLGLSTEDVAHDIRVTPDAMQRQAQNAINIFPELGNLNWVRAWGAIRVMTPDGGPIYDTVPGYSNIYTMALHSSLSLNPLHTNLLAPWILGGEMPEPATHFSNGRFNV